MVHRHLRGLIDVIDHCLLSRRAGRCGLVGVVESALPVSPAGQFPAEVIWHVPGEGRGTPALNEDTAFFLSKHHELIALDARSGAVKWRRPTHGPGATTAGTSVVVTPTDVIAGDGGLIASHTPAWSAGAYRRPSRQRRCLPWRACRRDAPDGILRWPSLGARRSFGLRALVPRYHTRTFDDRIRANRGRRDRRRVIHCARRPSRGGLVAADLTTGRRLWRRSGGFAGGPLAAGMLVLAAGRDGSIHAFDRRTGATRWSVRSHLTSTAPSRVSHLDARGLDAWSQAH